MAYDQTKPQSTDTKSASQPVLLENFLQIYNFVGQDHEQFNSANAGKHKWTIMPEQGTDITAAPQTQANETAVYCRETDDPNNPPAGKLAALFFRPEGQALGAGTEYDFTTALKAQTGYCVLPCGIKICWGVGTINTGEATGTAITFAGGGFNSTCYSCVHSTNVSTNHNDGDDLLMYPANLNNTGFTPTRARLAPPVNYWTAPINFSYIAIGDA